MLVIGCCLLDFYPPPPLFQTFYEDRRVFQKYYENRMLLITRIEVRRILSIFMSIECASKKVGYFHPVPQRKNLLSGGKLNRSTREGRSLVDNNFNLRL